MKGKSRSKLLAVMLLLALGLMLVPALTLSSAGQAAGGITDPKAGATVSGKVEVTGLADDTRFSRWQLDLVAAGSADRATYLGGGDKPGAFSQSLDTTRYPNGNYTLRLRVVHPDANYAEYTSKLTIANPVTPLGGLPNGPVYGANLGENEKTGEVSTSELREILARNSAFVFDARPHEEYSVSHIPGALNVAARPGVPASQYVSDVAEIGRVVPNKGAAVVLYCNGPFCGKSKRLAEELLAAGYTNVRRYQLGIPVWRALVGVTQIELSGVRYVQAGDSTAVFLDARTAAEFNAGTLPRARNVPLADVAKAKDDGRLPMNDHNTRIIVFGKDGTQARAVAEGLAKNAFHNVAFYAGSYESLK